MARRGLSSCLFQDFVDERSAALAPLEPSSHSRHAVSLRAVTPAGTALGLQTQVVSPFFRAAAKRGVASALVCESRLNSMLTTSLRLSSERHLELLAHLRASDRLRLTLEAHESATDKTPASFARIGCDYRTDRAFAGAKIDAVNGPTLETTLGAASGVRRGDFHLGCLGAATDALVDCRTWPWPSSEPTTSGSTTATALDALRSSTWPPATRTRT